MADRLKTRSRFEDASALLDAEPGLTPDQLAAELGCAYSTAAQWRRRHFVARNETPPSPLEVALEPRTRVSVLRSLNQLLGFLEIGARDLLAHEALGTESDAAMGAINAYRRVVAKIVPAAAARLGEERVAPSQERAFGLAKRIREVAVAVESLAKAFPQLAGQARPTQDPAPLPPAPPRVSAEDRRAEVLASGLHFAFLVAQGELEVGFLEADTDELWADIAKVKGLDPVLDGLLDQIEHRTRELVAETLAAAPQEAS